MWKQLMCISALLNGVLYDQIYVNGIRATKNGVPLVVESDTLKDGIIPRESAAYTALTDEMYPGPNHQMECSFVRGKINVTMRPLKYVFIQISSDIPWSADRAFGVKLPATLVDQIPDNVFIYPSIEGRTGYYYICRESLPKLFAALDSILGIQLDEVITVYPDTDHHNLVPETKNMRRLRDIMQDGPFALGINHTGTPEGLIPHKAARVKFSIMKKSGIDSFDCRLDVNLMSYGIHLQGEVSLDQARAIVTQFLDLLRNKKWSGNLPYRLFAPDPRFRDNVSEILTVEGNTTISRLIGTGLFQQEITGHREEPEEPAEVEERLFKLTDGGTFGTLFVMPNGSGNAPIDRFQPGISINHLLENA